MTRVVRTLIVWVMVVAMPIQTFAAPTMRFCGPSHERMMHRLGPEAPPQASHHAFHGGHPAAAGDHGRHPHAGPAYAADPGDSGTPQAEPDHDTDGRPGLVPQHDDFSCSACASCCSVLALPPHLAGLAAAGPVHPAGRAPVTPIASHPPDGPERPPRSILA